MKSRYWIILLGIAVMVLLVACNDQASTLTGQQATGTALVEGKLAQATRLIGQPTLTPAPTSAPGAAASVLTPRPGQLVAADNGKTFTIGITWRIALVLREDQYPQDELEITCQPEPGLGSVSNLAEAPEGYYVKRYEGVGISRCQLRNGDFSVFVDVVEEP